MNTVADIRKDYKLQQFDETDAADNPFVQFDNWWQQALASNIDEVNAITLATVNAKNQPSARIVLLKGIKPNGFEFFTNYESHKASDIAANNNVALVFFWKELERQIRVEGIAEKTTKEVSDTYFNSRPEGSKIGAWSSPQSTIIDNRSILENNVTTITKQFENTTVERPPFWGGFLVKPTLFEFWQGRSSRLHDRIEYVLQNNIWVKRRLAP